jgi:putative transposase
MHGSFQWYNFENYHSGIAFTTPDMMHSGEAKSRNESRQKVLDKAYESHPDRFSRRPKVAKLPKEAWINKPKKEEAELAGTATTCSGALACV